jgi:hypothetical protein
MKQEDIDGMARMLQKNWGLAVHDSADAVVNSWEILRIALTAQLKALLTNDFERLAQTMYRLDVFEAKFHAALLLPDVDARAAALADVVLERELLRLETWRKYSNRAE